MENISNINYLQVVQQTREEKIKMYMKLTKKQLAEMLVNCNDMLDRLSGWPPQQQKPQEPCSSWANCSNPQMDCINCPLRNLGINDVNQEYPCYFGDTRDSTGKYKRGARWTPYGIETWSSYSSEE